MGRNGNRYASRKNDTTRQAEFNRLLSKLEDKVKSQNKHRNECVVVNPKKENERSTVVYAGVRCLSDFSADDLLAELSKHNLHVTNMKHNLEAGEEILFGHLSKHVAEVPCRIRLYFRTSDNTDSFARLQLCVERLYLEEHLTYLQGWILNVGPVFVLAPPKMSLTDGALRVLEALKSLRE
jgi:hypothetical protein